MPGPKWLEPPRHLLILFLATALLLVGALLWLGWQLARQDRELADKRLRESQETAADLCVAALQQALAQAEARLATLSTLPPAEFQAEVASYARALPGDSALVFRREGKLEIYPDRRLPFYPEEPAAPQFSESTFAAVDDLEVRKSDTTAALAALQPLSHSTDLAIRARALLRIASIHRRQKAWEAALGNTLVTGLPADLVAAQACMGVLEIMSRRDDAKRKPYPCSAGCSSGAGA